MLSVTENQIDAVVKTIADRMKKRREELELTQDSVAEVADLYISHYGAIERGQKLYRIDTFIRILDVLAIDLLAVFPAKRKKSATPPTKDPERSRLLDQVNEILDSGGEDAELAVMQISRWHKGLPKKRPQEGR